MSVTDMIKFKIKEVFWIRKTAEVPGPQPVLCPRSIGGSQQPPPPPQPAQILSGYITGAVYNILTSYFNYIWLTFTYTYA